jgi:hypothetical protein
VSRVREAERACVRTDVGLPDLSIRRREPSKSSSTSPQQAGQFSDAVVGQEKWSYGCS